MGIPLEENNGITSVTQLGLIGAAAGQFRELARWPSGALKWVLVDYQTDVPAGGSDASVTLVNGGGNFGGTSLATDGGSSILVNTGTASFTIRKGVFRFFDQIVVGGSALLSVGGEGLALSDASGVRFTSANDATPSVTVEENGPVRAVVAASGSLKNASGARLCDYLVRLHFYRGKSFVRAWVTLRNARAAYPTPFTFNSAEVVVPLSLGSGQRFTTATSRGTVSDNLGATETAYLFQAYSTVNGSGENVYANAPMVHSGSSFDQSGVEVRKVGGTIYQGLTGNAGDYAHGWAALEDNTGKGATVGLRWMSAFWPAGFELSGDGTARVELFSKRNSKTGIKFAWGAYESREIFFHFYTSPPPNRQETLYEMQYPLSGRAPLSQYAAAGAIYGETKLVSTSEQQSWFSQHGSTSPSLDNITPSFWRYHWWSTGGGGNQTDFALIDLIDFLRTGHGGFLAQGERNTLFKTDTAVRHSDGFDYFTNQIDTGDEGNGANQGAMNAVIFDFGHSHWVSIPIAYYLTGNELYREATVDYGEWKDGMADGNWPNYYEPLSILGDGNMRIWSRYYRDFAILWDLTRDQRYWSKVDRMTGMVLQSRDVPGSVLPAGRNLERGYMWMAHVGYSLPRFISDFFTVQIHCEAIWEGLRVLREVGDPRVEDFEDYLLGLADFIYNEFYFETGVQRREYGFLYSYTLDTPNTSSNPYWAEGFRPISSSRPFTFAYLQTGDPRYLDRQAKLLIGDTGYVTNRTPTDWPSQAYMATDLNRPPTTGWRTVPGVSVASFGGGGYRLSWTVPAGTTAFKIKYSEKPIVEWLGFNQDTRTYAFSPSTNTAWFAAANLTNEPAPAVEGTVQTVTLSGFDPSKTYHFAVKYATTVVDLIPPSPPFGLQAR